MRYVYLVMAVASLGMLGVFHKVADHRRCKPEAINFVLFLAAAIGMFAVSIGRFGAESMLHVTAVAWVTALVCGFLAAFATLNFQHGIRHGKISTSWLVINLSTALPTVLSIVIYHEAVSPRRALGLALAVLALVILWLERAREERAAESPEVIHVSGEQA
ncbi:MAG TPA: EamA family transporter [Bryobacteraceae bacterium]|jgi:drug/metabolite transporter (DMT)-like permease